MAGCKESRRSEECIDDSFWTQGVKELLRGGNPLELTIRNKKEVAGN